MKIFKLMGLLIIPILLFFTAFNLKADPLDCDFENNCIWSGPDTSDFIEVCSGCEIRVIYRHRTCVIGGVETQMLQLLTILMSDIDCLECEGDLIRVAVIELFRTNPMNFKHDPEHWWENRWQVSIGTCWRLVGSPPYTLYKEWCNSFCCIGEYYVVWDHGVLKEIFWDNTQGYYSCYPPCKAECENLEFDWTLPDPRIPINENNLLPPDKIINEIPYFEVVNDLITIKSQETGEISIKIFDLTGSLLESYTLTKHTVQIDFPLQNLKNLNGIYLFNVRINGVNRYYLRTVLH